MITQTLKKHTRMNINLSIHHTPASEFWKRHLEKTKIFCRLPAVSIVFQPWLPIPQTYVISQILGVIWAFLREFLLFEQSVGFKPWSGYWKCVKFANSNFDLLDCRKFTFLTELSHFFVQLSQDWVKIESKLSQNWVKPYLQIRVTFPIILLSISAECSADYGLGAQNKPNPPHDTEIKWILVTFLLPLQKILLKNLERR